MTAQPLNPCPFCGANASDDADPFARRISCPTVGCAMNRIGVSVEQWDRRIVEHLSQSIQAAAQRAAEEMNVLDLLALVSASRADQLKGRAEIASIILSHLAPHCAVNQRLLEAAKNIIRRAGNCSCGSEAGESEDKIHCDLCILNRAIAAAEAVQSQEKGKQ